MHRVPPSDVAADHALVGDVLPHLSAEVRLDLNLPETVDRLWHGRLRGRLAKRWGHEVWRSECMRGHRGRVCGRGEEGGQGRDLGLVQVADPAAVVDLHACAQAKCGFVSNSVEVRQGMLWVGQHRRTRRPWGQTLLTLTSWFSGMSTPRMCIVDRDQARAST